MCYFYIIKINYGTPTTNTHKPNNKKKTMIYHKVESLV